MCITHQQAQTFTSTPTATSTQTSTATATLTPGGPSVTPSATGTNTSTPTNQPPTTMCLAPAQDTFIIQDKANQNHGADTDMRIKPDAGNERRILIGFNLSSIPSSSTIISSTLRLYETTTSASQTITLYRLTNSWVGSQVNWNQRSSGVAWSTAGGDYQNTALATFSPNIANQYRDINVTAVTQGWYNGTFSNHGLLLRSSGANGEVQIRE